MICNEPHQYYVLTLTIIFQGLTRRVSKILTSAVFLHSMIPTTYLLFVFLTTSQLRRSDLLHMKYSRFIVLFFRCTTYFVLVFQCTSSYGNISIISKPCVPYGITVYDELSN